MPDHLKRGFAKDASHEEVLRTVTDNDQICSPCFCVGDDLIFGKCVDGISLDLVAVSSAIAARFAE